MVVPVRLLVCTLASAWLLAGVAVAQTGTLQLPARPRAEQPSRPPAAAPRMAVQRAEGAKAHPSQAHRRDRRPRKPAPSVVTAAPAVPQAVHVPAAPPAAAPGAAESATTDKLPDAEKPDPGRSAAEKPNGAGLPRFVSLRSDDVNMRAGPGTRYRIEWVYKRRDLPVEIEREFDVWRWVRDPYGVEGWVHQATLMGRRTFVVQGTDATLRSRPSDAGSPVAILKVGVIGRIRSCEASSAWCRVQAGSYGGYLRRDQFWGTLPGEAIRP